MQPSTIEKREIINNNKAGLAQFDRVLDYESSGYGFESHTMRIK